MSKFTVGTRVGVIDADTNEIRKGVINAVYPDIKLAIVKFDDGNVEKVGFNYLGIEPETKAQEEKPTAPVEKSEITITPDEFKKTGAKVMAEMIKKHDPMLGMFAGVIIVEIHKKLFFDEVNNE